MNTLLRLSLFSLLVLSGCGESPGSADASTEPADASTESDDGGVCGDFVASPPTPNPSDREVRLHVTGPEDAFVLTAGDFCAPFTADGLQLARDARRSCGCECPAPAASTTGSQIGDGTTVTWDASTQVPYRDTCEDCGFGVQAYRSRWVAQAVDPGTYSLTLTVLDEVPAGCDAQNGTVTCVVTPADGTACSNSLFTGRTVTVEVVLPPEGDVDIDVVVPPAS